MKQFFATKMVTLAMAAGVLMTLPACTGTQIAASAGVIGAGVICDGFRCLGDDDRYERGGGWGRGGWERHNHGGWHRDRYDVVVAAPAFVSTDSRVIGTAAKYGISHYAATYIVRAITLAQAQDTSGITDLGLTVSDFKDIYDGQALAADKMSALASKLLMSNEDTATLVQEMSADVQAEKSARGL